MYHVLGGFRKRPNARFQLLPEAGAQRTLEAVSCKPLFGPDAASTARQAGIAASALVILITRQLGGRRPERRPPRTARR
jgi:hypothetical protein